jgi:hypothetical protein
MINDSDEKFLRERFGLGPEDRFEELGCEAPPTAKVGRMREATAQKISECTPAVSVSYGHEVSTDQPIEALLEQAPFFTEVQFINQHVPTSAKRWKSDPSVFLLEELPYVSMVEGDVTQLQENTWILDSRWERAVVVVPVRGGEVFISCKKGVIRSLKLLRCTPTPPKAAPVETPARPDLEMPPLDKWLQAIASATWLEQRVHLLSESPSLMERIAAIGSVARLSVGTTANPSDLFNTLIIDQEKNPTFKAKEWAQRLDTATLERIELLVMQYAITLKSDLLDLDERVADDEESARLAARSICYLRDELESVTWVLRAASKGLLAARALESIDEEASKHLSAIACAADPSDDLLATVAWQEPDAWWGMPCRR